MKHLIISLFFVIGSFWFVPLAHAAETSEASIDKIKWASAPAYIQLQARNVVMHCSSGEYTPDQVSIFQYSNSANDQQNYILDFSAMKSLTQQLPGCNYNSPVCGPRGCFIMAYTQIDKKTWDQSWFGPALKMKIIEIQQNDKSFPAVEVTQAAESCIIVNGGRSKCPMHFTWLKKKFKYFGYAKLDPVQPFGPDGNPAPSTIYPIINATPDDPAQAPVQSPDAPKAEIPQAPATELPSVPEAEDAKPADDL